MKFRGENDNNNKKDVLYRSFVQKKIVTLKKNHVHWKKKKKEKKARKTYTKKYKM